MMRRMPGFSHAQPLMGCLTRQMGRLRFALPGKKQTQEEDLL